jgi:predicted membrane channel-forming protein YqfA (hemolysin III family)
MPRPASKRRGALVKDDDHDADVKSTDRSASASPVSAADAARLTAPSASTSRLLSWAEVPSWLQYNRFIHSGYRPLMRSTGAALASILQWHNETLNIWTHLLPLFFFLCLFAQELHRAHSEGEPHRALHLFAALGCVFVCTVSVAYHTLMCGCRSRGEYQRLLCVDVFGSVVVISTTAVPLLWFGNPCFSAGTTTWMLCLFALSTCATSYAIFQRSMTASQRLLLFGGHLLLRLALQFKTLTPKFRATGHHASLALHSESFLWLLLGGLVNVGRIPERFFSDDAATTTSTSKENAESRGSNTSNSPSAGRTASRRSVVARVLDYAGNSHNIWHLMSIYACYLTFLGVGADYNEFALFQRSHKEVSLGAFLRCEEWR